MKKTLIPLILALAPLGVSAHGVHGEPVPTVYYTPEAAYYVTDPQPVEHMVVSTPACGCCACPVAAPVLPPRPVIVRSVMPVATPCGVAYQTTAQTYVQPAPCAHVHTMTCQHHEVHHVEPDPGW